MTNYPAKIDNDNNLPAVVDNRTPIKANVVNQLRAAILAIESELGTTPSSVYGTVSARLNNFDSILGNLNTISLAQDLGGTLTEPLVIGLQGNPITTTTPVSGDVLTWNGIAWDALPSTGGGGGGGFTAGGDLSGTSVSQTVIRLQGRSLLATPPSTGQSIVWNGAAWAPGTVSSFIAGGDLSGSATNQTVIKINGTSIPATPTTNQTLVAFNGTSANWQLLSDSNILSGAAIAGTKISPNFGSQNISSSGSLTIGSVQDTGLSTGVVHSDSSGNFTSSLIINADVASGANLAVNKLASGTSGQVLLTIGSPSAASTWATLSGDVSISTLGAASVIGIQGIPVSATAPISGQVLEYNGTNYVPKSVPANLTGTAQNRPAATGSGDIYFCNDIPVIYVDASAGGWQQYGFDGYLPAPVAASNYTLVGAGVQINQLGDSIGVIQTGQRQNAGLLTAPSGGLNATATWIVNFAGRFTAPLLTVNNIPGFGVMISQGSTSGDTFYALFMYAQNASTVGMAGVEGTLATTSFSPFFEGAISTYSITKIFLRFLNDGINLHFQASNDGYYWGDATSPVTSPTGMTNYGFYAGSNNGTGINFYGSGIMEQNSLTPLTAPKASITGATTASPIVITTSTPHQFANGDYVVVQSVGGNTSANGSWNITVLSSTTFSLFNSTSALAYTSGGNVVLLSR